MITAIIQTVKAFFGFGTAVAKEVTQRDAEENTPAMQANATAAVDEADLEKAESDVDKGNLNTLRDDVAPPAQ